MAVIDKTETKCPVQCPPSCGDAVITFYKDLTCDDEHQTDAEDSIRRDTTVYYLRQYNGVVGTMRQSPAVFSRNLEKKLVAEKKKTK